MKSIKKVAIGFLAFSFMALNFIIGNSNQSNDKSQLSLANLNALQASAGEMYCDLVTQNACYQDFDGGILIGMGNLVYVW